MLESIRIQNYALIDDLEIEFQSGFNVLTGETGAGKSIIIGALGLVLGSRASSDAVRNGSRRAKIDALFRIPDPSPRLRKVLDEADVELDDGELVLSRVVTAEGRSRAYVSGNLVPLAVLSRVGDELVDVHGQHEHQSLLKHRCQLELLDEYASCGASAQRVRELVGRLRELDRSIAELEQDDRESLRRLDFLRHEVEEIDGADLTEDEETELLERRTLMMNAETIFTLASEALGALYESEDSSAIDRIGAALQRVEELGAIDGRFGELGARLENARAEIENAAAELRGFTEAVEFDPDELETINGRLYAIKTLKRKYGATIADILAHRDRSAEEIALYDTKDDRLAELKQEREAFVTGAQREADALSKKRRTAARKLSKAVTEALSDLGMKGARFEVETKTVELGSDGVDAIAFLLAANTGEGAKPLKHVASGGEMSRVMLALKSVLAKADRIGTLIFDEIDAGVGGGVANRVAEKMRALSATHQTVAITHLPQIAAAGDAHFCVEKAARKNRTVTHVRFVDEDERVEEVARLLDGNLSAVSKQHARELLEGYGAVERRESA